MFRPTKTLSQHWSDNVTEKKTKLSVDDGSKSKPVVLQPAGEPEAMTIDAVLSWLESQPAIPAKNADLLGALALRAKGSVTGAKAAEIVRPFLTVTGPDDTEYLAAVAANQAARAEMEEERLRTINDEATETVETPAQKKARLKAERAAQKAQQDVTEPLVATVVDSAVNESAATVS